MRPSEEQFLKYESERDVVFIFGAGASKNGVKKMKKWGQVCL